MGGALFVLVKVRWVIPTNAEEKLMCYLQEALEPKQKRTSVLVIYYAGRHMSNAL